LFSPSVEATSIAAPADSPVAAARLPRDIVVGVGSNLVRQSSGRSLNSSIGCVTGSDA
jgi:hypothetical protein